MPPTDSKLKQLRGALALPRVLPPRAESTCWTAAKTTKTKTAFKSGKLVRKPFTKWAQSEDLESYRYRAGSHYAPLRSPGRCRAVKPKPQKDLVREWLDEWAGGGPVIGEPSTTLGGSFQLTLVPRER